MPVLHFKKICPCLKVNYQKLFFKKHAKLTRRNMTQQQQHKQQTFVPTTTQIQNQNPLNISSISGAIPIYPTSSSSSSSSDVGLLSQNANLSFYDRTNNQVPFRTGSPGPVLLPNLVSQNIPVSSQLNTNSAFTNGTNYTPMTLNANHFVNHSPINLTHPIPSWCQDQTKLPSVYDKIWQLVQISSDSLLCDTAKLYPILLSSGLSRDLLANLWANVNHTLPGQLTKNELFIALAVVALIQHKQPSTMMNPFKEVFQIETPLIPNIQLPNHLLFGPQSQTQTHTQLQTHTQTQTQTQSQIEQQVKTVNLNASHSVLNTNFNSNLNSIPNSISNSNSSLNSNSNFNSISSTNPNEFDEFTDFKQAEVEVPLTDLTIKSSQEKEQNNKHFKFDSNLSSKLTTNQLISTSDINLTQVNIQTKNLIDAIDKKDDDDDDDDDDFDDFKSASSINRDEFESNNNKQLTEPEKVLGNQSLSQETVKSSYKNSFQPHWPDNNSFVLQSSGQQQNIVDKYSAFKELINENNSINNNSDNNENVIDDFGDFRSATKTDAESIDSLHLNSQSDLENISNIKENNSIQYQVLHCCKHLIHKAFNVLVVNHGEETSVEALNTREGRSFVLDIVEVYKVTKRIRQNCSDNCKKLIMEIDNVWSTLMNLFNKSSINVYKDFNQERINQKFRKNCVICQSSEANDSVSKVILFAGYEYHSTCANLWLNCINASLPQTG